MKESEILSKLKDRSLDLLYNAIILLEEKGDDKDSICEEVGLTAKEYDYLMLVKEV